MKHLASLALIPIALSLSSCALVSKLIQTPVRIIQAGVRTVTDADETTPPATAEAMRTHGIALKASESLLK